MSEQSDALFREVFNSDPVSLSFRESLNYVIHYAGSRRKAATAMGVGEASVRRWLGGTTPKGANQTRVIETVRGMRLRPSKLGDQGVLIHGSNTERRRRSHERDISGKDLRLAPGTVDAMRRVWIATGDTEAAARRFVAGIGVPWYRREFAKALDRSAQEGPGKAPQSHAQPPAGGGGAGGGGAGGGGAGGGGGGGADDDDDDLSWYAGEDVEHELPDDYGFSIG